MRWLLVTGVLLMAGFAIAIADACGEELARSVTVSAQSEVAVVPDEVLVDFTVSTENKDLVIARSKNDEIAQTVFQLTSALALTPENVRVTDLTVSPAYDRWGTRTGYSVDRSIAVRIHRFKVIEDFIGGLLDAGVTDINRLKFQVRDQRPHQREARRLAFEYAREKATHLAELGGMTLGDVITIEEDVQFNQDAGGGGAFGGFGGVTGVWRRPRGTETIVRGRVIDSTLAPAAVFRTVAFQETEPAAADEPSNETNLLTPGVARLNATVTVKFELRKK